MHLLDEVLEHSFDHIKVGDYAIFKGANGYDMAWGLADHGLSLSTHSIGTVTILLINGDDRGLGHDDTFPSHMNKGICRAEVDAQVTAEQAEQSVQGAYHWNPISSRRAGVPAV